MDYYHKLIDLEYRINKLEEKNKELEFKILNLDESIKKYKNICDNCINYNEDLY